METTRGFVNVLTESGGRLRPQPRDQEVGARQQVAALPVLVPAWFGLAAGAPVSREQGEVEAGHDPVVVEIVFFGSEPPCG